MKKYHGAFFGFAVILAAAIFTLAGCGGDDATTPSPVITTFTGTAGGKTYTLEVTDDTTYVLTVGTKKSSGTVTASAGGVYTLKPSKGSDQSFTVTASNGGITAMSGKIIFDDDTDEASPSTLTPPSTGGGTLDWSKLAAGEGRWIPTNSTADDNAPQFRFTEVNGSRVLAIMRFAENQGFQGGVSLSGNTISGSGAGGDISFTATLSANDTVLTIAGLTGDRASLNGTYKKYVKSDTGGSNPFKGTWTGATTTPGGAGTVTVVFEDITFETTTSIENGLTVKQKGTYTYTSTSVSGTITAIDAIYNGTSQSGGWVSSGEFFDTYTQGNTAFNGTLSNGKLVSGETQLTKSN